MFPEGINEQEIASWFTKNGEDTAKDLHSDKIKEEEKFNLKVFEPKEKTKGNKEDIIQTDPKINNEQSNACENHLVKEEMKLKRKKKEKSVNMEENEKPKRFKRKAKIEENNQVGPVSISSALKPKIILQTNKVSEKIAEKTTAKINEKNKEKIEDKSSEITPLKKDNIQKEKRKYVKRKDIIGQSSNEQKYVQRKLADFIKSGN